ncbi:hybrid sensor histidine kinase/response regulator [Daejeonella sp.]|uniref:hybrid sensor histidine kinase/response regulator n=1 Tax=Daejeonella sp. TaxID=2805397 RepID=UPI0026780899|nr:hybrid sensor histidine kinase/response regulator [Daejeonella sp.]HQT23841.1 hybrid sensor histidine kinase/response regulator [Daejeonella sp.]HQT58552.1 hybrid sensor histidine kinase/response regulator [Daejeonella sp.]
MEKQEKIKILYVDDEINNLTGFKASFRMNYNIMIAVNATDAMQHLSSHPDIRVIFCDQRMPGKTGVQFFEEIRSRYPKPIRILLTGYTDIDSVIDSINLGNVFRYVKKPWADDDILGAINEANKFYVSNSLLAVKNEELQRAYNELDKFSYSVTHDMRGPLLSVLGAIEAAQHMDDITEIRKMLMMMKDSVRNLDDFIQSIHDYYNLNRGELEIKEIDFNELVEEQIKIFNFTYLMSDVTFNTNIIQKETFRGDVLSVKLILNNLLSNAFKYQRKDNKDKTVDLNILVENGHAVIDVIDNGVGIAENYLGDIFNMFFRASTQDVGSGFGLYNVKAAVTKLNGKITVDSEINKGTHFKVLVQNK